MEHKQKSKREPDAMNSSGKTDTLLRETRFHDLWAKDTDLNTIDVIAPFESITALENRFIMKLLGDIAGKAVLDVGPGFGESSIYFAMKGALTTAVDISPQMIETALQNAQRYGVKVTGVVCSAETLNLPKNSFDIVYAANVIHHITEREQFYKNVRDVLKPGGIFVAWDPLKYNPLIKLYRRKAVKVRTADETPLGFDDLNLSKKYFPNLRHREFWCCTLALFIKYYLINRYDVNQVRYWKRILKEDSQTVGWWFIPLYWADCLLFRLPIVRRLAWNTVQWGNKL